MKREILTSIALPLAAISTVAATEQNAEAIVHEVPMPEKGIDFSSLPHKLPKPVERQLGRVVAVEQLYDNNSSGSADELANANTIDQTVASGVIVSEKKGTKQIISAGHLSHDFMTGEPYAGTTYCGNLKISFQTKKPTGITFEKQQLFGDERTASSSVSSFQAGEIGTSTAPDLSMAEVKGYKNPGTYKEKLEIDKPRVGETVFFANYQPDSNGVRRTPNMFELDSVTKDERYAKPAVYPAVAIHELPNGNMLTVTGLDSFGEDTGGIYDNHARAGASGGAVLDKDGELVGISVSGPEYPTPISVLAEKFDVKIEGIDPNKPVYYAVIQEVKPYINEMKAELADAACEPNPGH